jgi:hypothetical protein
MNQTGKFGYKFSGFNSRVKDRIQREEADSRGQTGLVILILHNFTEAGGQVSKQRFKSG